MTSKPTITRDGQSVMVVFPNGISRPVRAEDYLQNDRQLLDDLTIFPRGAAHDRLRQVREIIGRLSEHREANTGVYAAMWFRIEERLEVLEREAQLLGLLADTLPAPNEPKEARNARLRKMFDESDMTVNEFALAHDGKHGVSAAHLRRLLSDWRCATNAQHVRAKPGKTGTVRTKPETESSVTRNNRSRGRG